jgi:UDP-N-acetylmuramoyl-L-alanyl-D-glutamate--2,6-diaminopimelate ligase
MTGHHHNLAELLRDFVSEDVAAELVVTGLAIDSRRVTPGDLFLAMPGVSGDGRDYIRQAVDKGAVAVVYEGGGGYAPKEISIPQYAVSNLNATAGLIADRFFDSPSRRATVIGVTGTNGKTTCTHLLAQCLNHAPHRCAVIGTLGNGFPGELDTTLHTTPDPVTVHKLLARYIDSGASHVCIEVSSHALEQGRVNGVAFDIAVFTNLSRDHLDYHGDMDSYGAAKAGLFTSPGLKVAVINQEDDFGRKLLEQLNSEIRAISFGLESGDFHTSEIKTGHEGLILMLATPDGNDKLTSHLFGRFNASNLLAAVAVLMACDMPLSQAIENLSKARPVAGRMERFGGQRDMPLVVVDYAHTPDALEKVLLALREHTEDSLWCVFGCGGDRDRGKRPQMGEIAERLADHVILTDDNPRHEDPENIVADILRGMKREHRVVHRRIEAITNAIESARPGDIILLAGKGHEDYQQIGDERIAYSDRDTVRELLGEAA